MSLLEIVQGLIERTYAMRSGLSDLGAFVIGDQGYQQLYRREASARVVGTSGQLDALTLIRETTEGLRATVYYPDFLIRLLERYPPQRGLREENVQPFAVLVEELDHLLLIATRSQLQRPVTLFELELQANVSKHLVLARFLAGREPRLSDFQRYWLRHHLFDGVHYCDEDPDVRARYRDATRWGVRFLDSLAAKPPAERIPTLRRFHTASASEKIRLILQG